MLMKRILNSLASRRAPGPLPSFSIFDILRFLRLLAETGCIGRGKISEKLDLGEGSVRTMLKRLTEAGLVTKSRSGCLLTCEGKILWSKIEKAIPKLAEIEANELTMAPYSVAVLVRGQAKIVGNGLEQRDIAVMNGAKGAVTIVAKNDKLIIPSVSGDLGRDYPLAFKRIMQLMKPKDEDVIIISSANSLREAEYGALAAALSLVNNFDNEK